MAPRALALEAPPGPHKPCISGIPFFFFFFSRLFPQRLCRNYGGPRALGFCKLFFRRPASSPARCFYGGQRPRVHTTATGPAAAARRSLKSGGGGAIKVAQARGGQGSEAVSKGKRSCSATSRTIGGHKHFEGQREGPPARLGLWHARGGGEKRRPLTPSGLRPLHRSQPGGSGRWQEARGLLATGRAGSRRERASPAAVSGDTMVVSTASWAPFHKGSPLAMTSMRRSSKRETATLRSRTRVFVVTRAPASRHTRAAARSSGQPRLRSAPDREHAARWSPRGSRGRRIGAGGGGGATEGEHARVRRGR